MFNPNSVMQAMDIGRCRRAGWHRACPYIGLHGCLRYHQRCGIRQAVFPTAG